MSVYDPFLDWLGRAWLGGLEFLRTSLGKAVTLLMVPVMLFFGLIFKLIIAAETHLNDLIDTATDALGTATSLNIGTSFGIANHFFPLDLLFEYSAILAAVWLISLVYRFIKSWIPTVN